MTQPELLTLSFAKATYRKTQLATRDRRALPAVQLMNFINVISGSEFITKACVGSEPHAQCERDAVVMVGHVSTDVGFVAEVVIDGRECVIHTLTHLVHIGQVGVE